MTFHRARPNTEELGGILNGSITCEERCEHVHVALSRGPGKGAAQVPVSQGERACPSGNHLSVAVIRLAPIARATQSAG